MASIGPQIPAHLLASTKQSTTPSPSPPSSPKRASGTIGPQIPAQFLNAPSQPQDDEEEDEDDYAPELPPDLVAAQAKPPVAGPSRPVIGPSIGPQRYTYDDDSDEEIGPAPLPSGYRLKEKDAVKEFIEKEEQRRKAVEV